MPLFQSTPPLQSCLRWPLLWRGLCLGALLLGGAAAAVEPTKLSGTLPADGPGLARVLLSGVSYGVFRGQDASLGGVQALFRVANTAVAGTPLRVSGANPQVSATGYEIAPNGFNVVFPATIAQYQPIYATRVSGPTSVDVSGTPPLISGATQWCEGLRISPDSTRVVFRARRVASNPASQLDLYSAPIAGGGPVVALAVTGPSTAVPGVGTDFEITADSTRVVFRSTINSQSKMALYSVPIDGSALPTLLSAPLGLGATHIVNDFKLTPNGARVVYRSDFGSLGYAQLYSVAVTGGAITALPATLLAGRQVYDGYQISSDSARVVFKADREAVDAHDLYAIGVTGGALTRLSFDAASFLGGNVIGAFAISPDSARVVYIANKSLSSNTLLYSVAIVGGVTWQLGTFWGDVFGFQIAPDASRIVFAGKPTTTLATPPLLWSVPTIGGELVSLFGPVPYGDYYSPAYAISPDSQRVVFTAEKHGGLTAGGDPILELFSTPTGGGLTTKISGVLVPGGSVTQVFDDPRYVFAIGPDSKRVMFVAKKDTTAYSQMYGAPIDGGGALLDIDGDRRVLGPTDALLLMRRKLGETPTNAMVATVGSSARRSTAASLGTYADALLAAEGGLLLDIDGNGSVDASTDLLLLLRYTLGFRGNALLIGALGISPARGNAAAVEDYLNHLMERSAALGDLVVF